MTHLQFERDPNWHHPHPGDHIPNLVTKTVSGFMNFVTTVGNTVMVFTPQLGQASRPATGRLKDNDYLSTIKHIQSVNFYEKRDLS